MFRSDRHQIAKIAVVKDPQGAVFAIYAAAWIPRPARRHSGLVDLAIAVWLRVQTFAGALLISASGTVTPAERRSVAIRRPA